MSLHHPVVPVHINHVIDMYGDYIVNVFQTFYTGVLRGLPSKLVGNFGSRNYFQSDLLRLWACICMHHEYTNILCIIYTRMQMHV